MPFTRPVAGVIFDMDGLLIDTERVYLEGLVAAALACGREMTDALAHAMIGVPGQECIAMIEAHYGPGFDMEMFGEAYDRVVRARLDQAIPLRPGARELVTWLSAQGIPQAIATSSRRPTVERYMAGVGLLEHFSAIVTRDDVAHAKPAPDPFLAAAERLGLEPAQCLALEDSYHGIVSAHAAGCMPIMVPDLLAVTDAVRAQCIAVADDLRAVRVLLEAAPTAAATAAAPASW